MNYASMEEAVQILKQKRISVTHNRLRLLQVFIKRNASFSHAELFCLFKHGMNRTSLFRNLNVLIKNHILVRISCMDGRSRYALELTNSKTSFTEIKTAIVCSQCHDVEIVSLELLPKLTETIARGFTMQQMVIEGICKECK